MSFFDALFGRTRLKKPQFDPFFRLSTSMADLEAKGLTFAGAGAVCCRPSEEVAFADALRQAEDVTRLYADEHKLPIECSDDKENFRWIVLRGPAEDVITGLHALGDTLSDQGYGGALLAALFPFRDRNATSFLVYNYKRGRFYPFRPTGRDDRDEAREIQLQTLLSPLLPVEGELERWYPIWDNPLGDS